MACYFCPLYVALGVFKVDAYTGVISRRLDFVAVDYELAVGGYAVVYGVAFYVDEFVYPAAGVRDAFDVYADVFNEAAQFASCAKAEGFGCFLWSWISDVLLKVPPTFGWIE